MDKLLKVLEELECIISEYRELLKKGETTLYDARSTITAVLGSSINQFTEINIDSFVHVFPCTKAIISISKAKSAKQLINACDNLLCNIYRLINEDTVFSKAEAETESTETETIEVETTETEANTEDTDTIEDTLDEFDDFATDLDLSLFDGCTADKSEANDYATWAAEMDAKLKAAIAEDELDINDDFYASYRGVVKPRVYFNGVDTENQQTYDELIDNFRPMYSVFE